jgi:hypothetical protein
VATATLFICLSPASSRVPSRRSARSSLAIVPARRSTRDAVLLVLTGAEDSLDHDVRSSRKRLHVFGQLAKRHDAMPLGTTLPFVIGLPGLFSGDG